VKCFDVVQKVLDATYEAVPNKGGTRDSSIAKAIASTRKQYRQKLMTEGGPDFDNPATRFGYVFTYVPAHAHWLYELISGCDEAKAILDAGKARITCIGGGPGSDVVGVLKYLDENDAKCKLFIEIIDGCEAWKTTWSDLAYELDWDEALHTDYVIHNVSDESTWSSPSKISKADIITLSFFVSEIYHLDEAASYLTNMLGSAKDGAIVLVNDNRTEDVYNLMDKVAATCGYKILQSDMGIRKIYDSGESTAALKKYSDTVGGTPRLTGDMFLRIYQKAG